MVDFMLIFMVNLAKYTSPMDFMGIHPQQKIQNVYIIFPSSTKRCALILGCLTMLKFGGGEDLSLRLMEEKPCTSCIGSLYI